MTDQFIKSIKSFLKSKAENALMIDGAWGKGKTYYIKSEQFEKDIERKVIYTSVFGIKDLKEIDDAIVYEKLRLKGKLGDIAKNKNVKVVGSIGKTVAKAILKKVVGLNDSDVENINDTLNDLTKVDLSELISIADNQVLIIDDLERLDKAITYHDLFGYISSNFTEGNGIKVILICNESFIHETISTSFRKNEPYKIIKEKTVWRTINFEPNLDVTLAAMIQLYGNPLLAHYEKLIPWIIRRCKEYKIDNLRTINYTLDILNQIHTYKPDISGTNKMMLFCTSLILANEFKEGRIPESPSSKSSKKYYQYTQPRFSLDYADSDKDETGKKVIAFSNRYLRSDRARLYFYMDSVYHLVVDGFLDESQYDQELKKFNTGCIVQEPHRQSIETIKGYIYIEQEKLDLEMNNILDNIDNEMYTYYELLEIAIQIEQFKNRGMSTRFTDPKVYTALSIAFEVSKQKTEYRKKAKVFRSFDINSMTVRSEFLDFFQAVVKYDNSQSAGQKNQEVQESFTRILKSEWIRKEDFFDFFDITYEINVDQLAVFFSQSTNNMNKLHDYFYDSSYITDSLSSAKLLNEQALYLFRKQLLVHTSDRFIVKTIADEIIKLFIRQLIDKNAPIL
ncbi:MAG: hypothetical protein ACJATI_001018 [Halioglobus sp.]|jgi:hypothetical protein